MSDEAFYIDSVHSMMEQDPAALLLVAVAFAAEKHRNQRRKDAEASPYINHPIAVARVLAEEGGITDAAVLCAALFHDTIEDTETTPAELRERFGAEITQIVLEVTDDKSLPKPERKRLQVEDAALLCHRAKLVKLADKICNLRDILASPPADCDVQRKAEYFGWAKNVVDGLRGAHPKLEGVFDSPYAKRGTLASARASTADRRITRACMGSLRATKGSAPGRARQE